jgi:hypothetical protein
MVLFANKESASEYNKLKESRHKFQFVSVLVQQTDESNK